MYFRIITNLIFIVFLAAIQITFVGNLPFYFNNINLLIIVLVFVLVLGGLRLALTWAVGLGILFDFYYFLPFGSFVINLFLTSLLTYFLLRNFFTNRSLYSFLALGFFANISYNIILFLIIYLNSFLTKTSSSLSFNINLLKLELMQIILNSLVIIMGFYLINFITYRWRPVFLLKENR